MCDTNCRRWLEAALRECPNLLRVCFRKAKFVFLSLEQMESNSTRLPIYMVTIVCDPLMNYFSLIPSIIHGCFSTFHAHVECRNICHFCRNIYVNNDILYQVIARPLPSKHFMTKRIKSFILWFSAVLRWYHKPQKKFCLESFICNLCSIIYWYILFFINR